MLCRHLLLPKLECYFQIWKNRCTCFYGMHVLVFQCKSTVRILYWQFLRFICDAFLMTLPIHVHFILMICAMIMNVKGLVITPHAFLYVLVSFSCKILFNNFSVEHIHNTRNKIIPVCYGVHAQVWLWLLIDGRVFSVRVAFIALVFYVVCCDDT